MWLKYQSAGLQIWRFLKNYLGFGFLSFYVKNRLKIVFWCHLAAKASGKQLHNEGSIKCKQTVRWQHFSQMKIRSVQWTSNNILLIKMQQAQSGAVRICKLTVPHWKMSSLLFYNKYDLGQWKKVLSGCCWAILIAKLGWRNAWSMKCLSRWVFSSP